MIYVSLFISFFKIGLLSFGGGYASMPLIQEEIIQSHQWLTMEDFADLVTIAEMTPGPIAVNAATFVGTQVGGVPGAVVATLGCIFPACVFVTLLAFLYNKYRKMALLQGTLSSLRPAVVSMIAKAGLGILISVFFLNGIVDFSKGNLQFRMIFYFLGALILLRLKKLSPILIMVLCGVLEGLFVLFLG